MVNKKLESYLISLLMLFDVYLHCEFATNKGQSNSSNVINLIIWIFLGKASNFIMTAMSDVCS